MAKVVKERWNYLTAWCCGEPVAASHEARVKLKTGEIEEGAVCECRKCGKKYLKGIK